MNEIEEAERRREALLNRIWRCTLCQHRQKFREIYNNHMRCTQCNRLDACVPDEDLKL